MNRTDNDFSLNKKDEKVCPHCGRCPTCGQSAARWPAPIDLVHFWQYNPYAFVARPATTTGDGGIPLPE